MHSPTEERTWPQSRAVLPDATVAPRKHASAVIAGGLLAVLLAAIVVAVVLVSDDSKQPLPQPNPLSPTTSAPMPSPTMAEPSPAQVVPTSEAPPVDTFTPSQVTAETIAPRQPFPRHWRLRDLFPQLFPNGSRGV